jgi:hypothetical protein
MHAIINTPTLTLRNKPLWLWVCHFVGQQGPGKGALEIIRKVQFVEEDFKYQALPQADKRRI